MRKITLTCKEMSWLCSKELDTHLPFITKLEMKMHRALCKTCFTYRRQIRLVHSLVKCIAPEFDCHVHEKNISLSSESKARLKKYLSKKSKEL